MNNIEKQMLKELSMIYNFDKRVHEKLNSVDAILDKAHYLLSVYNSNSLEEYGWCFRECADPKTGVDFHILEEKEDKIFEEFVVFFDFYYKYRNYSEAYRNLSFKEYLEKVSKLMSEKIKV
ncbi:hypothetical protein [Lactococcus garvieae]|uniref:hypothetical protein n=1 Tax=Lactococcus garvieae TaxID=1363 RepID=UPI00254B6E0C|nr:hypothetical protein [Lactococcus garvieae]